MSGNSSVYFILWILLQVLVKVNCQMTPFKPSVYSRHTATLIDNKLYILGGLGLNNNGLKEFFYLDVSVPFSTQELSWQDLSNINMVPLHFSAMSVKGGVNNDTLFLYGGLTADQTMALVYTFDSQSIVWSIPKIAGVNTIRKRSLTGIINNDGRMYLWGGCTNTDFVNDMLILDTINLNWSKGSIINAPTPRTDYGAILLPNNKIIYMGGNDATTSFDTNTLNIVKGAALTLSEIYVYDMINDNWDTKVALGKIPSNRGGFSAVLGLDGKRIIIFGGYFINPGYLDTSLYVLDLANYNWYIPKISGKIPKPRAFHQTNVIGKYMVVSFGKYNIP
uniref:Galactose oxidase n=1 Tax=Rhizophagus irregularis (strain DAOM 181602 / DAOM 197198 / MUCL 43194) TaxID=747089 RepID=U9U248_RHIID